MAGLQAPRGSHHVLRQSLEGMSLPNCTLHRKPFRLYPRASCLPDDENMHPFRLFAAGIGMVLAHVPPVQPRRIGPAEIYPDPARTPGAANPQVTQRNIKDNICNPQWSTKLVRPPSEYTSKLKRKQLREYGDTVHQTRAELVNPSTGKLDTTRCLAHSDNMACYEEDHLIPLEDGGDPTDPRNLWPEPYNTHVGGAIMGRSPEGCRRGFHS